MSISRNVMSFIFHHGGTSPTKSLGRYLSSPMIVRSTTGGPIFVFPDKSRGNVTEGTDVRTSRYGLHAATVVHDL